MQKIIITLIIMILSGHLFGQLNTESIAFEAFVGGGTVATGLTGENTWGSTQETGVHLRLRKSESVDVLFSAGFQRLSGLNETYLTTDDVSAPRGQRERIGRFYQLNSLGMGLLGAGLNMKIRAGSPWRILIGAQASYLISARIKNYNSIWRYNTYTDGNGDVVTINRGGGYGYTTLGESNPTLTTLNLAPYFGLSREILKGVNVELTASRYLFNIYETGNKYDADLRPTLLDLRLSIRL